MLEHRGLSSAPIDEVSAALDLLRAYGPLSNEAEIEVDLSLARGLRYYTGLGEKAIATAIQRRPGTVKSRLAEARRQLAEDPALGQWVAVEEAR